MSKQRYLRLNLARQQLETAVALFFRQDYISVITLAGAASGIFTQLVLNAGKEPFVDYGRTIHGMLSRQQTPGREKYNRFVNDKFGINAPRHHRASDAETIDLDASVQAEQALVRALVDYIELRGQTEPFVIAILQWLWVNRAGPKAMAEFAAVPDKLKKKQRPL